MSASMIINNSQVGGRLAVWRPLKFFICTLVATIICYCGVSLWHIDRDEERTINLVTPEPQPYPSSCGLHATSLQWDRIPIFYGLMLNEPNNEELYPYSNKWESGGCLGGGPRHGFTLYCQQCRAAESLNRTCLAEGAEPTDAALSTE